MNDFDRALEDCLDRLSSGASTLDECLARYPAHAARLRPFLWAAVRLERGRDIRPSPAFKARARARLTAHMQTHPRRRGRTISPSAWRLAASLATLAVVFLITGTAFAQGALPGDQLFGWKLTSEQVWRTVSPDPAAVDLKLTQRRAEELLTVSEDPYRSAQAMDAYQEALAHLTSEADAQDVKHIKVLESQQEAFSSVGISVPELDAYLSNQISPREAPPAEPNPDPTPEPEIPPPLR